MEINIGTEYFRQLIVFVIMIAFSIQDIRKKQLSCKGLIGFLIIAVILSVAANTFLYDGVFGFMTGGIVLIISKLSGGQIGSGDALLLMAAGTLLGLQNTVELLLLALVLAAARAGYLLVIRRAGRRQEMAFVPFLAMAELLIMVMKLVQGETG